MLIYLLPHPVITVSLASPPRHYGDPGPTPPSLRGAQRRRNPFVALAAASSFITLDQRQCLEQGLKLLLLFKDGLRRRNLPTLRFGRY